MLPLIICFILWVCIPVLYCLYTEVISCNFLFKFILVAKNFCILLSRLGSLNEKKFFALIFFIYLHTSYFHFNFSLSTATRTIKKEIPLQKFLSKIFTYIFRRCYVVVEISSLFSFSSSEDGVRRKMVLFARTTITGCNISIFSRPLPWK